MLDVSKRNPALYKQIRSMEAYDLITLYRGEAISREDTHKDTRTSWPVSLPGGRWFTPWIDYAGSFEKNSAHAGIQTRIVKVTLPLYEAFGVTPDRIEEAKETMIENDINEFIIEADVPRVIVE